ncbi:MAG: hypothetical protein R3E89_06910 [Thiolinea sp.]
MKNMIYTLCALPLLALSTASVFAEETQTLSDEAIQATAAAYQQDQIDYPAPRRSELTTQLLEATISDADRAESSIPASDMATAQLLAAETRHPLITLF